jgi:hypothetical protein
VSSPNASKRGETTRIDSATVALWRGRRDRLEDKLTEHEQAEWDWLWRTRLSVLEYLIRRYDNTHDAAPLGETPTRGEVSRPRFTADVSEEPVSPYNRVPVDGTAWIADQKREAIQDRLASLRCANAQRHAEAEKLAEHLREAVRLWQRSREQDKAKQLRLAKALSDLSDPEQHPRPRTTQAYPDDLRLAEALSELDEREHKALRRYIAFDLGVLDDTDEPLDDETIRQILIEHGIAPGQGD